MGSSAVSQIAVFVIEHQNDTYINSGARKARIMAP